MIKISNALPIILFVAVIAIVLTVDVDVKPPYTEVVTLDRQYIGNISDGEYGGCENCLMMDVSDVTGERTYYFAGEFEPRTDLIDGTEINVRWEYSYNMEYYKITGVYN